MEDSSLDIKQNDIPLYRSLQYAYDVAKKWVPPISESDKIKMINMINGTENSYGTYLLKKYIELLKPYTKILGLENNKPREYDCVASSLVFFYGCLFYIMHFPGWGSHIQDIFLYNLLYILVDHYIDDVNVNDLTKNQAISQMFILIYNPLLYKELDLVDPTLEHIAIIYDKLLTRCPNIKEPIIKLFKAEIDGMIIQKDGTKSRSQYYDIALRKGGLTMEILQYIVGDVDRSITAASYHLGTIMQILDDVLDVNADKENGIHTIATHDLNKRGCLDDLWIDIMNRIDNIDHRFTIFKIVYTAFAIYLPDRLCENYSEELRYKTNPINLFDYNYGCDGSKLLVDAVMNELMVMEILEEIVV